VSLILALDTTGEAGSIALLRGADVLEQVELASPDGFAHVLFGEIEALLARHRVTVGDMDLFASASGPGSFTGVRVGLTAVKGLAEAAGKKAAGISNLRAIACFGSKPLRAALIDARRGEIYGGVYNAALDAAEDEVVMPLNSWLASLPAGDIEIIAGTSMNADPRWSRAPRALAAAIGKIAATKPELARDPAEIDANYVRRSDAELLWKA